MVLRTGSPSDDTLVGTSGDDSLYGFDLKDLLYGKAGNDLLDGGSGTDTLYGGYGNDTLIGELDGDLLYGNAGNDVMQLNSVVYHGGGKGWGGEGDDLLGAFDTGEVWANGGAGNDTLGLYWYNTTPGAGARIDISTGSGVALSSLRNKAHFTSIEHLIALTGGGDDTVTGGAKTDAIDVGAGANTVDAREGNDTVSYQLGQTNVLDGGLGDDTLIVHAGSSPVYFIVDLYDGDVDDGQLSSIRGFEHYTVYGGSQNDIIALGNASDRARGGDGQDTILGLGGKDTIHGDSGDDHLVGGDGADALFGERGNDVLEGDAGNDRLYGGFNNDELYGGDGKDILSGGKGTDTLFGGAGADEFVFLANEDGWDVIADFTSGEDKIKLTAATLGVFAPPLGQLQAEDLPIGGLRTDPGIFVLVYDATTDRTDLQWTDNGHGTFSLMRFEGNVSLAASDIYLI